MARLTNCHHVIIRIPFQHYSLSPLRRYEIWSNAVTEVYTVKGENILELQLV
jgi:hypothetical protein